MFCPYCGKNNKEEAVFCQYCKKAMTKGNTQAATQSSVEQKPNLNKPKTKKIHVSFTAIKGIITVLLLAALVLIILWLYYPSMLPWNW